MKKTLKWILISLNCLVILFLLLFSSLLICFSLSNPAQIGGYKALLVEGTTDNAAALYILRTDFAGMTEGTQILLLLEEQPPIPATILLADGIPCIPDADGSPLPVTEESFGGIVVFQSTPLGGLLQWISAPGNLFYCYLLIGGGFFLLALIMLGLYLLSTRRLSVLEEEDEAEDSSLLPDGEDKTDELSTSPPPDEANVSISAKGMDLPIYEAFFPSDKTPSSPAESAFVADTPAPPKEDVIIYSLPAVPPSPAPQTDIPSETNSPAKDTVSPSSTETAPSPKSSSELSAELILDDILKSFQDELLK